MGGSKNAKHLENLAHDPTKVISSSRFMGRVEVPLSDTLSMRRGESDFKLGQLYSPPPAFLTATMCYGPLLVCCLFQTG